MAGVAHGCAAAVGLRRRPAVVAADARRRQARRQPCIRARITRRSCRRSGLPNGPLEAVLTPRAADVAEARALLAARGWDGRRRLVALAPGAAYGTAKQWLPEHFVTLVGELVGTDGATCVLVGGAGRTPSTTAQVRAAQPPQLRDSGDRPGRRDLAAGAGRRAVAGRRLRLERLGRHARGGRAGRARGGHLRPDHEQETAPLGPRRAPGAGVDAASGLPALYAAGVSDRPPVHDAAAAG